MAKQNGSPNQPRKVIGQPLLRSDEELDELSQVTEEDIEAAKAMIQQASPLLAKLLDAKEVSKKKKAPSKK